MNLQDVPLTIVHKLMVFCYPRDFQRNIPLESLNLCSKHLSIIFNKLV